MVLRKKFQSQILIRLSVLINFLQIALQLLPETKTFINLLKTKDESYENFEEDTQTLISLISPVLEEIHCILVTTSHHIFNWI